MKYFKFKQVLSDGVQEHNIPSVIKVEKLPSENIVLEAVAKDEDLEMVDINRAETQNYLSIKVDRIEEIKEEDFKNFFKLFPYHCYEIIWIELTNPKLGAKPWT